MSERLGTWGKVALGIGFMISAGLTLLYY